MSRAVFYVLAAGVSLVAFSAIPQGAHAQQGASSALEEIVVTARKREETIQEIPVAVTAISSSQIEDLALQSLQDISKLTAGLVFDNEFGRTSDRPVIRGQANILGNSGVSYFIDGVYINGSIADYDLNDVERIEVVKGPQSALYGRNTYSGAINIITKSPGDQMSFDVRAEFTDDGQQEFGATLRGPIVADVLSGGITFRSYELDGPWTNTFDGSDIGDQSSDSFSGVLVLTPSDRLEMRLRAYYNEMEDGQPPLFHQNASENNCINDNGGLYQGLGRYYCGEILPGVINTDWTVQAPDAREEAEVLQTSLSIDFDINDNWSLTSITGLNERDSVTVTDGDYQPTSFQVANFTPNGFPFAGFPVPPFDYAYVGTIVDFTFASEANYEDFSQELRLNYEGDNFSAMFGAYYFDASDDDADIRALPAAAAGIAGANFGAEFGRMQGVCAANPICASIVPFFGPTITVPRDTNNSEIQNTAFFAMADFELSDTVGLTIEGRSQSEDIDRVAIIQDLGMPADPAVVSSASFDSFSARASLDWQVSETSMLYGVIATGTKPGGFNGTVAIEAGLPSFDEEDVTSFEIGSKNVLADGQVVANLAMFFNQVDGYQLTQNARAGANTVSATVNAGDADILGLEAEIVARPDMFDGLTLTLNYAYTDSEFTRGRDQNEGVLNDARDNGLVDCSIGDEFPDDPSDPTASCNASMFGSIVGRRIPRTAEHQLYADIEVRRPMSNDWEWFVGTNLSYESSKFSQVHNLIETGDTTVVNARLGFTNDRYSINLWGRNLTGEDTSPLVLRYADGADSFKRSFVGTLRRDTYWGLSASARFGN